MWSWVVGAGGGILPRQPANGQQVSVYICTYTHMATQASTASEAIRRMYMFGDSHSVLVDIGLGEARSGFGRIW